MEAILSTWKSENQSNSNSYCTLSIICLLPLQLSNPRWTDEETEAPGSRDLRKATQVVNMGIGLKHSLFDCKIHKIPHWQL